MISDPEANGQNDQSDPQPKTKITNQQIVDWGTKLNLSKKAIAQIKRMNGSDPVRLGSGRRGVRGVFPSSIMGCMLNYESRTCEGSYLWLRHAISRANPDRPKMILCQPCWLDITRDPEGEKKGGFKYPPDYFELTDTWAGFIECKWERDLENSQNPEHPDYDPWRYQKLASGEWVSAPAEAAARFYDLPHRIWVMSKDRTQIVENIQFLTQYFDPPTDNYKEDAAQRILAMAKEEPGIQLRKIHSTLKEDEVDTLFFCIARQELHVDIENEPISPNLTPRAFSNVECANATLRMEKLSAGESVAPTASTDFTVAAGTKLTHGDRPMVIVRCVLSENFIELHDPATNETSATTYTQFEAEVISGVIKQTKPGVVGCLDATDGMSKWRSIEPHEWIVMNRLFASVERFVDSRLRSRLLANDRPTRNQFRLLEKCRVAGARYGPGYEILGLQPKPRKGNTLPKLDADADRILQKAIKDNFLTKQAPSVELVWGLCTEKCEAFTPPLKAPSRKTVAEHIKKEGQLRAVAARQGPKTVYQLETPFWNEVDDGISVDGEFAWAVAHIDHTQLDTETEPTADGLSLGRPWLTLMVAPRQKRVLAYSISYEPPSYRSCMSVMRECVRRHRRLPAIIVTDNGKEFAGHYFSYLVARFRIVHMFRPPAAARFGSYLERFNRLINSKLIHNLPGNTKATLRVRELVRAHDPKQLATLSITDLDEVLEEFLYRYLEEEPDKITGLTPRRLYETDLRLGGPRTHKIVVPNREFFILTCPTTTSAFAVVRRDGMKVNHIYYRCRQLRDLMGRKLHIRYNDRDLSIIYVRIRREWVDCHCERFHELFKGLSERELRLATTLLLAGCKTLQEKRRKISARRLAQFFNERALTPDMRLARRRAKANAEVKERHEKPEQPETPGPESGAQDGATEQKPAPARRRKPKQMKIEPRRRS